MVLVRVMRRWHQDQVGRAAVAQLLKDCFGALPVGRQPPVWQVGHLDLKARLWAEGFQRGPFLLLTQTPTTRKDEGGDAHLVVGAAQREQRAASAEGNVVAVRPEQQQLSAPIGDQTQHLTFQTLGDQTLERVPVGTPLPQHPRSVTALVGGLQFISLFDCVGRMPEASVWISHEPALLD